MMRDDFVSSELQTTLQKAQALLSRLLGRGKETTTSQDAALPPATSFKVIKQQDGSYRWVALATNRYKDRDGEILSAVAHKEFVDALDKNLYPMPDLWLWHTPGSKVGKADFADFDGDFLWYSGSFDSGMEEAAKNLAARTDLGVSHGFWYEPGELVNGVYQRYQTFEVSPLPSSVAANPWTAFETIAKELKMAFTPTKRSFLVDILGEESVKRFESDSKGMAEALIKAGVDFKAIPDEQEAPHSQPKPNPDPQPDPEPQPTPAAIGDAVKAALKEFNLDTLHVGMKEIGGKVATMETEIKALGARVATLEKSDDEKIADLFRPKNLNMAGYRATAANNNRLGEDDPLKTPTPVIDSHFAASFYATPVN